MIDTVLDGMASEMRNALLVRGLDPQNPPTGSKPPANAAYYEYLRRGGKDFKDPVTFIDALITKVGEDQ